MTEATGETTEAGDDAEQEASESPDSAGQRAEPDEPTLEEAEELIKNPGPFLSRMKLNSDSMSHVAEGFRAMREGLGDFFVAGDRSAGRTKDTADKVVGLIETELAREGLSPQERLEFIQSGERMAGKVGDSEKEVRDANERTIGKIAGIAAGALVGVAVLGYLAKEGKLPIDPSSLTS